MIPKKPKREDYLINGKFTSFEYYQAQSNYYKSISELAIEALKLWKRADDILADAATTEEMVDEADGFYFSAEQKRNELLSEIQASEED